MVLRCKHAETCHQFFTACRCKTRCKNRFDFPAACMTVQIDFCFSQWIFCCLNKKLRRITIHIDFSYKTIHALFFHFPEQIVCGLTVNGSKNIGMKCSVTNHIIHKSAITLLCIRHIFKSCFLRKCVMIQPIGKKTIHAYSTLHILWTMHM